jgi:hypothetical protein
MHEVLAWNQPKKGPLNIKLPIIVIVLEPKSPIFRNPFSILCCEFFSVLPNLGEWASEIGVRMQKAAKISNYSLNPPKASVTLRHTS